MAAALRARALPGTKRACADAGVDMVDSIAPGAEAVRGDADRLEQALQNLAANALRYAPRGTTDRAQRAAAPPTA